MGSEGAQCAWNFRVAQLAATAHEDDFVQVALIVGIGSAFHNVEGRELTYVSKLMKTCLVCTRKKIPTHNSKIS